MQITDTNARLAEINAKQKQNEADIINYQRSNRNTTDTWDEAGGYGGIGAAAGLGVALGAMLIPGLGPLISGGIVAGLMATGFIAGGVTGIIEGDNSKAEEKAFEEL